MQLLIAMSNTKFSYYSPVKVRIQNLKLRSKLRIARQNITDPNASQKTANTAKFK